MDTAAAALRFACTLYYGIHRHDWPALGRRTRTSSANWTRNTVRSLSSVQLCQNFLSELPLHRTGHAGNRDWAISSKTERKLLLSRTSSPHPPVSINNITGLTSCHRHSTGTGSQTQYHNTFFPGKNAIEKPRTCSVYHTYIQIYMSISIMPTDSGDIRIHICMFITYIHLHMWDRSTVPNFRNYNTSSNRSFLFLFFSAKKKYLVEKFTFSTNSTPPTVCIRHISLTLQYDSYFETSNYFAPAQKKENLCVPLHNTNSG